MADDKTKSAVQADSQSLSASPSVAKTEDRQFLAASSEAPPETPRRQVLEALEESLLQYDELYRKLAQ